MKHRGKGEGSLERVEYTALAIEAITHDVLDKAVSTFGDTDVFAFRNGRRAAGTKPSTINRDLRTLRAALKLARPEYRFPGKAFFKEDETRVRWLRPEEELLVLEPMASPFREIAKLAALTGRPRSLARWRAWASATVLRIRRQLFRAMRFRASALGGVGGVMLVAPSTCRTLGRLARRGPRLRLRQARRRSRGEPVPPTHRR